MIHCKAIYYLNENILENILWYIVKRFFYLNEKYPYQEALNHSLCKWRRFGVLQPQQVALALKAEAHFDKIYLVGKRGARAEDLRGLFVEFLNVHNYPHVDYVVVDCGSNDIVHGTPVLDVAATISVAVSELLEEFHIRHVAVCSIIHRQAALGG